MLGKKPPKRMTFESDELFVKLKELNLIPEDIARKDAINRIGPVIFTALENYNKKLKVIDELATKVNALEQTVLKLQTTAQTLNKYQLEFIDRLDKITNKLCPISSTPPKKRKRS